MHKLYSWAVFHLNVKQIVQKAEKCGHKDFKNICFTLDFSSIKLVQCTGTHRMKYSVLVRLYQGERKYS